MTAQEKAGMIDKMPMDKRMAMMHKGSMMKGSGKKMDKKMDMEKMPAKPERQTRSGAQGVLQVCRAEKFEGYGALTVT